jgi:glutamate racemase
MLGIFDSGFGGLTVLRPIHEKLPRLSTVYLGDNARAPYGVRTQEEIYQFTLEGVRFLFDLNCQLVVLACNTASAQALRRIQNEVLPMEYPDRRVLGVIRPASEYLSARGDHVGIFATPATVESNAYVHELKKLNPNIEVTQVACPGLTNLIEAGHHTGENCNQLVKHFTDELFTKAPKTEKILLGCTHYPLVQSLFETHTPKEVQVYSQGAIVADTLDTYLERHPDIKNRLDWTGQRHYFTTNGPDISKLASLFYGDDIQFQSTNL